jgi:Aromatic ring hydroxylase
MGIMTSRQYLDSLRAQHPCIYIGGERVENVADSPWFSISLRETCTQYDWPGDPALEKDFAAWSPFIEEKVSFWTHLRLGTGEVRKMVEVIKRNNSRHFCSMCMGIGLSVMWATTWDIDRARGTNYHANLRAFFEEMQRKDLRYCMGVMDPKGDRSLPPSRQADPDLHLRVVSRNREGIVVRGAKTHTSNAPLTHYIFVSPSRVLGEEDKDYAVSFVTPIETKGPDLHHPAGPGAPGAPGNGVPREHQDRVCRVPVGLRRCVHTLGAGVSVR